MYFMEALQSNAIGLYNNNNNNNNKKKKKKKKSYNIRQQKL